MESGHSSARVRLSFYWLAISKLRTIGKMPFAWLHRVHTETLSGMGRGWPMEWKPIANIALYFEECPFRWSKSSCGLICFATYLPQSYGGDMPDDGRMREILMTGREFRKFLEVRESKRSGNREFRVGISDW